MEKAAQRDQCFTFKQKGESHPKNNTIFHVTLYFLFFTNHKADQGQNQYLSEQ